MDNNVIHSRRNGDGVGLYADSIDRGPRGYTGEKGDTGEQGERGIGVNTMKVNSKEHLIVTLTDNTKVDAGELPKIQSSNGATFALDGTNGSFELGNIKATNVSYITINGLEYYEGDGYSLNRNTNTLNLILPEIPVGIMRVIVRSHAIGSGGVLSVNGQIGDVNIKEPEALTASKINQIIAEVEND